MIYLFPLNLVYAYIKIHHCSLFALLMLTIPKNREVYILYPLVLLQSVSLFCPIHPSIFLFTSHLSSA